MCTLIVYGTAMKVGLSEIVVVILVNVLECTKVCF